MMSGNWFHSVSALLLVCLFLGAQCYGMNIGQIDNKTKKPSVFNVENEWHP